MTVPASAGRASSPSSGTRSVSYTHLEDVEDSLRRLHTDHLDVLYTHWQTPDFGIYPLEETVEAMMKRCV